jgi:DNA-binding transcriptional MerR regulator
MSCNYVSAHLYRTQQVAKALGVNKKTIYRWLVESIIPEPNRTENGYRVWTEQDVQTLRSEHPRRRRRAA